MGCGVLCLISLITNNNNGRTDVLLWVLVRQQASGTTAAWTAGLLGRRSHDVFFLIAAPDERRSSEMNDFILQCAFFRATRRRRPETGESNRPNSLLLELLLHYN